MEFVIFTGVGTDASDREIKKKFRKLAIKYHPDKVKEEDKDTAEEKFKELALCYESYVFL